MLTLRFCDPVLMARRAKLTLLALAFTPLCAPFASTPKPYEAPEGQILIRDTYQLRTGIRVHPATQNLQRERRGGHRDEARKKRTRLLLQPG